MTPIRLAGIALAALGLVGCESVAEPPGRPFAASLSGAQEVPPVTTAASGTADIRFDPATRKVTWTINYNGLSGPATMAHFHGPAMPGQNGPVVVWLSPQGQPVANPMRGEATLTEAQAADFMAGRYYVNVHTDAHKAGEIRGQVSPKP